MEYLERAITNYLKSEESFALCIDGGWGTGKTHFIKNFTPYEFDAIENETKFGNDSMRKIIYISLYGKGDIESIKNVIVSQILIRAGSNTEIGKNVTGGIAQYFSIPFFNLEKVAGNLLSIADVESVNKLKKDLDTHDNELLIIIDDLERISDKSDINELLGFVRNELLDILESKVIIVGNLMEIEMNTAFKETREKVIGRTLKFDSNLEVGYSIIKNNLDADIQVDKNKEMLAQILSDSELISRSQDQVKGKKHSQASNEIQNLKQFKNSPLNLRTLEKVISDYNLIMNHIQQGIDEEVVKDVNLSLFCSLFMVNNELRNDNYDENSIRILQGRITYESEDTKLLYGRYIQGDLNINHLIYIPSYLTDFVLYNDTDFKALQKSLNDHFNPKTKEPSLLEKLNNMDYESEDDLKEIEEKLVASFYKDININVKLDIYLALSNLNKYGLLLTGDSLGDLEEELLKSYNLSAYKKLSNPLSDRPIFSIHRDSYKDEIKSKLIAHEKKITQPDYEKYIQAILSGNRDIMKSIEEVNKGGNDIYIFPYIKQYEDLIEESLIQSTGAIRNLYEHIAVNYLQFVNPNVTKREIEELKCILDSVYQQIDDKVQRFNLKNLNDMLDELNYEDENE